MLFDFLIYVYYILNESVLFFVRKSAHLLKFSLIKELSGTIFFFFFVNLSYVFNALNILKLYYILIKIFF